MNKEGTPLLRSVLGLAEGRAGAGTLAFVFVNCDIVLFDDAAALARRASAEMREFLIVGRPQGPEHPMAQITPHRRRGSPRA